MGYFLAWAFLSLIVGALGSDRKIGFFWALFFSLLFSPVVGILIVAFSDKKLSKEQQDAARIDQLDKLLRLKQGGAITEEDYDKRVAALK